MAAKLSKEQRWARNKEIGIVTIKNSRFIFKNNDHDSSSSCNLAGNPRRSNFGSPDRTCTIVIPNERLAKRLQKQGVNVKVTENRRDDPEFAPEYFMAVKAGYKEKRDDWRNPVIRIIKAADGMPVTLDRDELDVIDEGRTGSVKVQLNPSTREDGGVTMYIQFMDVELLSNDNPFDDDYHYPEDEDVEPDELPFL